MIQVYTDGASSGNPGLSGAGIMIKSSESSQEYAVPLGLLTNHEAEFHAVIRALDLCIKDYPDEILSFHSDSQLVVQAVERNFVKNKIFKPLLKEMMRKAALFSHFFIKWIPSGQNAQADRLAKQAIHLNEQHL